MLSPKILRLGENCKLVEHKKTHSELPVGCSLVYCAPFSNTFKGWVVSKVDANGYQDIIYETETELFSHSIQTKTTEPISEKFGIGIYYEDSMETILDWQVDSLIEQLKVHEDYRASEAIAQEKRNEVTKQNLIGEYDYLEVLEDLYDMNENKKNLVRMLKKKFPNTKFSVRKNYYNSYTVRWTDGASKSEVEEVTRMFNGYSFDQTGDFYDSNPSIFNRLFGNIKFINVIREYSEEIEAIKDEIREFTETNIEGYVSSSITHQVFNNLIGTLNLNKVNIDGIVYPDPMNAEFASTYGITTTQK